MLVYQKTMFDSHYCINSFCHLKNRGKHIEKFNIFIIYNGSQKHKGLLGFKNACARAKTRVILRSLNYVTSLHVTVDDVNFCDCPGMGICKVKQLCINSMRIA